MHTPYGFYFNITETMRSAGLYGPYLKRVGPYLTRDLCLTAKAWAETQAQEILFRPDCVFVYGTLRQGSGNHRHIRTHKGRFVGKAVLKGYKMLNLGGIPGIVPGSQKLQVVGEVYRFGEIDSALASLDRLEAHPRVYQRQAINVTLDSGQNLIAWVYVWRLARNFPQILSGDWRNR